MSTQEGVKQFSEMTTIEKLRNNLQPQGTAPIVRLHCGTSGMYLNHDFVTKCIDELELMQARTMLGAGPSNLEKLAYMLLKDSAYIESK